MKNSPSIPGTWAKILGDKMKFITQFSESQTKKIGGQKWDHKKTFKLKGKEIVIKDYVQENAEGTDFYENLERFGNLETTIEFMSKNRKEIIGKFEETENLRNIEEKRNEIKEIWKTLPAEIKNKFDNNLANFIDNGYNFFTKNIEENIKNINQMQNQKKEKTNQEKPQNEEKKE